MNDVDLQLQGYQMCLEDFTKHLEETVKRWNGVKTSYDAWRAFNDIIHWTHSTKLQLIPVKEPVGGTV